MTTAAAIAPLGHYGLIVELNLPSFRLEEAEHATDGQGSATTTHDTTPASGVGTASVSDR